MTDSFRRQLREWDLSDLRGAEFLRLLRLAHDEGLLAELLSLSRRKEADPEAVSRKTPVHHSAQPHQDGIASP